MHKSWCTRKDLNPEPPEPKSGAYPVELRVHLVLVYHNMKKKVNLIVLTEEKNLRLDVFINNHQKDISRTRIKNLILDSKIKLNNTITLNPSKKILPGDEIYLEIPEPKKASLKPYDYKLEIVF